MDGQKALKSAQWEKLKKLLVESSTFALTTHIHPEGDAIGSELALGRALKKIGKKVRIANSDPVPRIYSFLDSGGEVELYQSEHDTVFGESDMIIVVDVGVFSRLGSVANVIRRKPTIIACIDHHITNKLIGDINILEIDASATAELIYDLVCELDIPIGRDIAEPLFVGLATDTGWFRFMNATARSFRIASELVERGVEPAKLYREIYEMLRPQRMRLLGEALRNLQTELDNRIAYFTITRDMFNATGATEEDLEGFVDELKVISGTEVVILFREMPDGSSKANLRSKGNLDVGRIAEELGGGGHHHSSAITSSESLSSFRKHILERLRREFEAIEGSF